MVEPSGANLSASVTVQEASSRIWDVLVIGAGPAGSVLARELAREGLTVLLVDKASFPRDKVCGCCLNGAACAALAAVELPHLPEQLGAIPTRALQLRFGRRRATLPLPAGASVSRRALDGALVQAAMQAGVAFLSETEAVLESQAGSSRVVQLRARQERRNCQARIVVAADGLAGSSLRAFPEWEPQVSSHAPIGLGTVFSNAADVYEPGVIYMACGRVGYVGAVRLEEGRLDVAAALDPRAVRAATNAASAMGAVLQSCGLPLPADWEYAAFRGTPPLTRRRVRVADVGLFVTGDAAAYIEPLTGEGMSWALQESLLLTPIVLRAARATPAREHAEQWQSEFARFVRDRRGICRAATWIRRHPLLAAVTVATLSGLPILSRPWVRAVNRPVGQLRGRLIG